jgi:hypothetical protein
VIQNGNAPTLCPRCVHFTKGIEVGCRIGNWGIEGAVASGIQRWLKSLDYESSWTYQGACPSFKSNGSDTHLMSAIDQVALRKLLARLGADR